MRILTALFAFTLAAQPLSALETGKPSAIDPAADYYTKGRDAAKKGDFTNAAKLLRSAYYAKNDASVFFWYCDALSRGGFDEELIREFEAAKKKDRYSKDYGAHTARMTAETLRRRGEIDKAADILVQAYRENTRDQKAVGSMLIFQNMLDTGLSTAFMKHPEYGQVLDAMCSSFASSPKTAADIADAKNLYFFLILSAAERAMAGDAKSAEKLITKAELLIAKYGAMDPICNPANFGVIKKAVLRHGSRNAAGKPYIFRWLCLYTNGIDAQDETGRKIFERKSDVFIRTKIEEIRLNLAAVSVFYSYISGGRIEMEFDIRRHDAVSTAVTEGKPKKADMRSLDPFPASLMKGMNGRIDGVMFFYPAFDPVSYLGGGNPYPVVPYILDSKPVFMLNMISGAAANVFIHEIFHGFESRYRISEAHLYAKENASKWPAWYRDITVKNGNETAEWTYYERIFADRVNTRADIRFPAQDGAPYRTETIEKAGRLFAKYGAQRCREISRETEKAEELAKKDKAAAGKAFEKLASSYPDFPDVLFKTGYFLHWTMKDREKAQVFYDRYLELYTGLPSTFTAALYSCTWYANKGDSARVISITGTALPFMTDPYDTWHLRLPRAKALALSGRTDEASAMLSAGAADAANPLRADYEKELVKLKEMTQK